MGAVCEDKGLTGQQATAVYGRLRTHGVLFELEELETIIGRGGECDLVLDGQGISAMHAKLIFDPGLLTPQLTDLGSVNGTFVNDVRLLPYSPYTLGHADVLQFSA